MKRRRILLVEDNEAIRELLTINLETAGYDILQARNGVEGLQQIKGKNVDLVISDVMMPEMDGLEFCRQVRVDLKSNVPFIFFTGINAIQTELTGIRNGADEYLVKSEIKKDVLLKKIEFILQKADALKIKPDEKKGVMSGKIETVGLIQIIQFLIMNRMTGKLNIHDGENKAGIDFKSGKIVHCQYKLLTGEDAFYNLNEWNSGEFLFENTEPDKITIQTDTMTLVMEYCRLLDETRRIGKLLDDGIDANI